MSTQPAASVALHTEIDRRPIAVVVASRQEAVRSRLRQLLDNEDDMRVIAEASDLDGARAHVHHRHPDVVALAVNTQGLPDLGALRSLFGEARGTQYVVMDVEQSADWEALPDAIRFAAVADVEEARSW
jgi:DNA-binding NarL/FixJ family response regulator